MPQAEWNIYFLHGQFYRYMAYKNIASRLVHGEDIVGPTSKFLVWCHKVPLVNIMWFPWINLLSGIIDEPLVLHLEQSTKRIMLFNFQILLILQGGGTKVTLATGK